MYGVSDFAQARTNLLERFLICISHIVGNRPRDDCRLLARDSGDLFPPNLGFRIAQGRVRMVSILRWLVVPLFQRPRGGDTAGDTPRQLRTTL